MQIVSGYRNTVDYLLLRIYKSGEKKTKFKDQTIHSGAMGIKSDSKMKCCPYAICCLYSLLLSLVFDLPSVSDMLELLRINKSNISPPLKGFILPHTVSKQVSTWELYPSEWEKVRKMCVRVAMPNILKEGWEQNLRTVPHVMIAQLIIFLIKIP